MENFIQSESKYVKYTMSHLLPDEYYCQFDQRKLFMLYLSASKVRLKKEARN